MSERSGDGRQAADRHLDRLREVRGIHGLRDVERAQVAGDVLTDVVVGQVVVVGRGLGHLQDLRAQVRHGDAALDRVRLVHRVLEDDVGVAGLELDLRDRLEEATSVDLTLVDAPVIHHLVVLLRHRNLGEGHAVHALHVVGAEQVHVLVLAGQLERDVRDDDAQGQRLDADLLVRVLTLGVQELHDVRVVRVQVHGTRALTRAQLVRVGEGVLKQLHDGHDAAGLVLNLLNGGARLAEVRQLQGDAAAALGQLQRGVDAARDRLHVVLDAQQEAGDQLAARRLTRVQESRGGRLEAAAHDLVDEGASQLNIAARQVQGHHGHAILETLQVALTVEGLERVRRVVLERAQERREAELVGVGLLVQLLNVREVVLIQDVLLVVALVHQVLQLLFQVVEEHRVLVDVLEEVLASGLTVRVELDASVRVVQVKLRVQRVVVQLRGGSFLYACVGVVFCQNCSSPSRLWRRPRACRGARTYTCGGPPAWPR